MTGSIDIAVPVIDVEVYDYCRNTSTFKMIITTNINGTYQNVVFFYEAQLDFRNRTVTFSIKNNQMMSAARTQMDTFFVT
jgi:hypothetical protein